MNILFRQDVSERFKAKGAQGRRFFGTGTCSRQLGFRTCCAECRQQLTRKRALFPLLMAASFTKALCSKSPLSISQRSERD